MHLQKMELFYQKINKLRLTIHDIDGWYYKYNSKKDGLVYSRKSNNGSYFTVDVFVDLDALEFYKNAKDSFAIALNEGFSEEYARRVSARLTNPKSGLGSWTVCK